MTVPSLVQYEFCLLFGGFSVLAEPSFGLQSFQSYQPVDIVNDNSTELCKPTSCNFQQGEWKPLDWPVCKWNESLMPNWQLLEGRPLWSNEALSVGDYKGILFMDWLTLLPVLTKFNGLTTQSWNSLNYLFLDVVENLYKSLSCCQNRITCCQASYVIINRVQFAIGQHSNHSQLVVRFSILRSQFIGLEIPRSYGRPVLIGKKLSLISFNISKTD